MKYRVTQTLEGKSELHPFYPLLPGDILTQEAGGSWRKHAPGLSVGGFFLTEDDETFGLEEAPEARWMVG